MSKRKSKMQSLDKKMRLKKTSIRVLTEEALITVGGAAGTKTCTATAGTNDSFTGTVRFTNNHNQALRQR